MPEATVRLIIDFVVPFEHTHDEDAHNAVSDCIAAIEQALRYERAACIVTGIDEIDIQGKACSRCGTFGDENDLQTIEPFYNGEKFCEKCYDKWHDIYDNERADALRDAEDNAIDKFKRDGEWS
jgi:hypothetical protein